MNTPKLIKGLNDILNLHSKQLTTPSIVCIEQTITKLEKLEGVAICAVCECELKAGESMQAFLRCPEDPKGSWTKAVVVDADFKNRIREHGIGGMKRKHETCISALVGEFDGCDTVIT